MKNKLKPKVLKDGDKVYFTWRTNEFGCAEFEFCPVYKRGKLVEIFIHPRQQENATHYFVYKFNKSPLDLQINSWAYQGLEHPYVWLYVWCKEHKCLSIRMHVPTDSEYFVVKSLSGFGITFGKE